MRRCTCSEWIKREGQVELDRLKIDESVIHCPYCGELLIENNQDGLNEQQLILG